MIRRDRRRLVGRRVTRTYSLKLKAIQMKWGVGKIMIQVETGNVNHGCVIRILLIRTIHF